MKPCKHLDYDGNYDRCHIETLNEFNPPVRYWYRDWVVYPRAPRKVQFCKLMGRINDIFSCYNPGERSCYDPL